MSDYTKSTNFATKDNLSSGNALKIVKGTEIDTEFNNIATAVATKADLANTTFTGTTTIATVAISAGTISGITDLAVADGGTGASTAANARTNLSAAASATELTILPIIISNSKCRLLPHLLTQPLAFVPSQLTLQTCLT